MSYVCNTILALPCLDKEEVDALLPKVNAFFDGRPGFVSAVHDEKLPRHWWGGSKCLQCDLWIGAFNYLNIPGLVAHLRALDWGGEDLYVKPHLQLIVQDEHDDKFRTIDIFPEAKT